MSGWQNLNDKILGAKFFSAAVEGVSDAGDVTWRGSVGVGAPAAAKLFVHDGSGRNFGVTTDAGQLGSSGIAITSLNDDASAYAPLSIVGSSVAIGSNLAVGGRAPTALNKLVLVGANTSADPADAQLLLADTTNWVVSKQLWVGYKTDGDYGFIGAWNQGTGATPLALQPIGGPVGVGTTEPLGLLQIEGLNDTGPVNNLVLSNTSANANSRTAIYMGFQPTDLGVYGARIVETGSPQTAYSGDLSFQVHAEGGANEDASWITALFLQRSTGKVGVHKTDPVYALDVAGTFGATGAAHLTGLPTYADEAAASSLSTGSLYQTVTGELRIKL